MVDLKGDCFDSTMPLLPMMCFQCCGLWQDASPDVRQSAFALVGDLSKVCPGHLLPCTRQLVTLAVANLQPHNITQENMSACNNACWSLGEPLLSPCPPSVPHKILSY